MRGQSQTPLCGQWGRSQTNRTARPSAQSHGVRVHSRRSLHCAPDCPCRHERELRSLTWLMHCLQSNTWLSKAQAQQQQRPLSGCAPSSRPGPYLEAFAGRHRAFNNVVCCSQGRLSDTCCLKPVQSCPDLSAGRRRRPTYMSEGLQCRVHRSSSRGHAVLWHRQQVGRRARSRQTTFCSCRTCPRRPAIRCWACCSSSSPAIKRQAPSLRPSCTLCLCYAC